MLQGYHFKMVFLQPKYGNELPQTRCKNTILKMVCLQPFVASLLVASILVARILALRRIIPNEEVHLTYA